MGDDHMNVIDFAKEMVERMSLLERKTVLYEMLVDALKKGDLEMAKAIEDKLKYMGA